MKEGVKEGFTNFTVVRECSKTNGRLSQFELSNKVDMPTFMPVATYGAMRSVPVDQLDNQIILCNTYHLRDLNRNIKEFMGWKQAILTDSGGFQIQSLPCEIVDEGIRFTETRALFTPEDSMQIQRILGPDIIMQLDDVVNPMKPKERHAIAVRRSIEWLDRAIDELDKEKEEGREKETISDFSESTSFISTVVTETSSSSENQKRHRKHRDIRALSHKIGQILFPIVQGGLNKDLRSHSISEILQRNPVGVAIGGMCGGEDKMAFAEIVEYTVGELRRNGFSGPVYVMGVGYPDDVVVCSALGTDTSDCVYPTRMGRCGRLFSDTGDIEITNAGLRRHLQKHDLFDPISVDTKCTCKMCTYSFHYLLKIKNTPNFCNLGSVHNLRYMAGLMERIRDALACDKFDQFVVEYFRVKYEKKAPGWIKAVFRQKFKIEI
ncbi:TGT [Enterospora canceri]|uniref:TGT n=1 Tax=Enterospora canceri TaxID=1081671 RepID=A0A1Y1S750_9MICR|nr:TGT [Enterospora canceri]